MKQGLKQLRNSAGHVYVSIFYDDEIEATVDVWTGKFETRENFSAGLILVLENINTFKARKWLADLSQIDGGFDFAREFIATAVIPKAVEYGLMYEALVLPNNIFAMLSVQETMEISRSLEIRLFGTVNDAVNWLNSKGGKEVSLETVNT